MANEIQSEFRSHAPKDGVVAVPSRGSDADVAVGGVPVAQSQGGDGAPVQAPSGEPEVVVESDGERELRERAEWLEVVDATEIIDGGHSTAAYRRAVAVFDPAETEMQLAEFWEYGDESYERNGRF